MADLTKWDVVVVGGANTDYLIRGKHLPRPGDTIEGETFQTAIGGKGVNQAVAASRMGARVAFVGRVGNDARGDQIIDGLDREGVDTSFISCTDHGPTGVALVMVDDKGEKQILTAPGANHDMRLEDVDRAAKAIRSAKALLVQLEIPLKVVQAALKVAAKSSGIAILDPAPAQPLKPELFRSVDIIRPNSGEARVLTGIECRNRSSARRAAQALLAKGVRIAIVQADKEGNLIVSSDDENWLPHIPVKSIDATGAGDAFLGTLAARLAQGHDLLSSSKFANAASALATTKLGAQAGLPTYDEVFHLLQKQKAA
jgi:ribokinase